MAFKDLYVAQAINNPIVIPPGPGLVLSQGVMKFTPPLSDYSLSPSMWDLQFSSASQLGASTRIKSFGLSSKLKKRSNRQVFRSFLLLLQ
jgi:hypothetical protein